MKDLFTKMYVLWFSNSMQNAKTIFNQSYQIPQNRKDLLQSILLPKYCQMQIIDCVVLYIRYEPTEYII